ncbi:MAG: hypothetical protein N3B15_00620 [Planctomycetota bacterium]|nr:hypothetical protein [Planctomycetota bacterium]
MHIYFCDECGARVTDHDLRGGRGMRARHATICVSCVDQGRLSSWLERHRQEQAAAATATAASSAVNPQPARTTVHIDIEEPAVAQAPAAEHAGEAPPRSVTAHAPPPRAAKSDSDQLASIGDGFAALMQPPPTQPSESPIDISDIDLVDSGPLTKSNDASSSAASSANAASAQAETIVSTEAVSENEDAAQPPAADSRQDAAPGRSTTKSRHTASRATKAVPRSVADHERRPTEAPAAPPTQSSNRRTTAVKPHHERPTPSRPPTTQRHSAGSQRASGGTTRATRVHRAQRPGNKVILFSLISCGLMLVIFAIVMATRGGKPERQVIHDEPLAALQQAIDTARRDAQAAMNSDDLQVVQKAVDSIRTMQERCREFQAKASTWKEEEHGEQLRLMGYYDVQALLRSLNDRRMILEQRGK